MIGWIVTGVVINAGGVVRALVRILGAVLGGGLRKPLVITSIGRRRGERIIRGTIT